MMADHQHTPEPWEWVIKYERLVGPADSVGSRPIVLDLDAIDWGGGKITEADARLIAAAPALLSACQALLADSLRVQVEEYGRDPGWLLANCEPFRSARAAIALALDKRPPPR